MTQIRTLVPVKLAVLLTLALVACDKHDREADTDPGAAVVAPPPRPLPLPLPPAAPPPPRAPTHRYQHALAHGRLAAQEGRLREARGAFEAALAASPQDPVALSELGWVSLRLGQLDAAEEATRLSIQHAADANTRASSLYNLGLILRRRGDLTQAADAFRRSLKERPHPDVQAALDRITGKAE